MEPNITAFLLIYPQFDNVEEFPREIIEFFLSVAKRRLPSRIWRSEWDHACYLFMAHELTLRQQLTKAPGQALEMAGGTVTSSSKTVGSLSKSTGRNGAATTVNGAGTYNLTVYGQELFNLAKIYGARVLTV